MSDSIVAVLAGVCVGTQPVLVVLALVAKRHSEDGVPLWQAAIFAVLFLVAVGGMAGMGVVGQEHFHGEFAEVYLVIGGILAFTFLATLSDVLTSRR